MPDISTQRVTLNVADGTTMTAFVAQPDSRDPAPGLMVFQEAYGVNGHIRNVTERLAREGYLAVAPELYHRTAPGFEGTYDDFESVRPLVQSTTTETLTADIRATFDWLRSNVHAKKIGAIGFCMGGRVSLIANIVVPLDAAITFYGGGIVASGLLDRVKEMHAPHLMCWGGLDRHITTDQTRAIEDAIRASGTRYINCVFSDADHGFFCDERKSYHPVAAHAAWALSLAFLSSHFALTN